MAKLPTVTITDPGNKRAGVRVINEVDFDPKTHELVEGGPTPDATQGADSDADPDADLQDMPWGQLRSFAAEVSEAPVVTKDDAIAAVKAHRKAEREAN